MLRVSCLVILMAMCSLADADVSVGSSDFTGNRTTSSGAGLTGAGTYSTKPTSGFKISWTITSPSQNGTQYYHYVYTLTKQAGNVLTNPVNTLYLQVSSTEYNAYYSSGTNYIVNTSATMSAPQTNSGFDYVSFSSPGASFSFDSLLAPSWGSFEAFGANASKDFSYNNSYMQTVVGSVYTNWIPTPGMSLVVPEPGLSLILGACLSVAFGLKNLRRRAQ